uniref:protein IQ-DOMAIN 31-like n=1 Tax=Erigeron canadensis TaxID=72917 RepID=UPI001CB96669|nr:protein IQ-DOMAIN 31-like [Erigeron canadensis]
MGKSPGKWIKTVIFGKKSSRSNLSKDATVDKKTRVTAKAPSKHFDDNAMVISSPVPPVMHDSGERTELKKTSSANLTSDIVEIVTSPVGLNTVNEDELRRLEQAAITTQAAFRGYMARRAFCALKGIIKLQAQVRGRLVRRQAVATLSCMRVIVEFQAIARGRRVRLSGDSCHVLQKNTQREHKHADLLKTSLQSEKLSTNAFGTKLVASSGTTTPLSIQYDPVDSNSVRKWLERWSSSHFWEPVPLPKKVPDSKPKRKPIKLQSEEAELGRPKRSVRRVSGANLEGNTANPSENEKPKPTFRKVSSHQIESPQEQSHSELEKVKHNLRKISVSTSRPSEKSESANVKSSNVDASEQDREPFEKVNNLIGVMTEAPEPEALPVQTREEDTVKPQDALQNDHHLVDPSTVETNVKAETMSNLPLDYPPLDLEINGKEDNSKENQKTRRRKSFPAKQEPPESVLQTAPTLPSYMAATESAKAKLRAQAVAKAAEDGVENGFIRRHSLPSSTGKLSLQSPRAQKPLQGNAKGWTRSNKSQISARDDKITGWKR